MVYPSWDSSAKSTQEDSGKGMKRIQKLGLQECIYYIKLKNPSEKGLHDTTLTGAFSNMLVPSLLLNSMALFIWTGLRVGAVIIELDCKQLGDIG